jgi:hypothetical protein
MLGYFEPNICVCNSGEVTNKMQPCDRIYYSTVHLRLHVFRAAHRSPSGALTVFAASGLRTHVVTGRSQVSVPLRLDYGRSPHAYVNQRLQIQLELLIMSGVPLETCWAFNERWNNKFYYKVASCWLFHLSHTAMHGSMNIKFVCVDYCTACLFYMSLILNKSTQRLPIRFSGCPHLLCMNAEILAGSGHSHL